MCRSRHQATSSLGCLNNQTGLGNTGVTAGLKQAPSANGNAGKGLALLPSPARGTEGRGVRVDSVGGVSGGWGVIRSCPRHGWNLVMNRPSPWLRATWRHCATDFPRIQGFGWCCLRLSFHLSPHPPPPLSTRDPPFQIRLIPSLDSISNPTSSRCIRNGGQCDPLTCSMDSCSPLLPKPPQEPDATTALECKHVKNCSFSQSDQIGSHCFFCRKEAIAGFLTTESPGGTTQALFGIEARATG